MQKKLISIVTPCFNEEANVLEHFNRVKAVVSQLADKYDFEHIYTDNASTDRTWDLLSLLSHNNSNVRALRFSSNIGANRAIFVGLQKARGEAVVLIQADLQDPPELIAGFIKGWEDGYDVVYGQISNREEGLLLRNGRKFYYWLIKSLAEIPIPQNAGEFRITSRRALDAVLAHDEEDPYVRGIVARVGFRQMPLPYSRAGRKGGRSSTNFVFLIGYAINGLVSTSLAPLRTTSILGILCFFVGFGLCLVLILLKLFYPDKSPRGFTMLACILTFFSGVQLLAIGILGEYLRKTYCQVLKRPMGFIDKETKS